VAVAVAVAVAVVVAVAFAARLEPFPMVAFGGAQR
jgi:hypothetical protein